MTETSFPTFFSNFSRKCLLALLLALFFTNAAPLQAESLFDEGRLQATIQRQGSVLVRIKSSIEETPEAAAKDKDKNTKNEKNEPKTLLRVGTGFFISASGQILTNASLVDGAKRLWYEVDGVAYLAELKGLDVPTNVALLQAKTMPKNFNTINLADNVSLPMSGAFLMRLSLPLEFPATPTVGIVQGADTQFGPRAFPTRYLRVQMGTGPGEAGGPVFDLQGRFVGMNVATLPELGATYVLPARALNWVREGLASSGGHVYSYFGFNANEELGDDGKMRLVVKNVEDKDKGPAAQAGLRVGDVIVEAGNKLATSISDVRDAAFFTKPGQYLDLKVRRANKDIPVAIQAVEKK